MANLFCTKVKTATGYALMPAHESDLEAIKKLPNHQPIRVKVTRIRNPGFHRKWFALLNYAFECWDLDDSPNNPYAYAGIVPEKSFDRFRKDITILCGFYESSYRLNGEVRLEAKSISFSKMDQDEFEELYTKTIDVIIKHVLRNYDGAELRATVEQIQEFDG